MSLIEGKETRHFFGAEAQDALRSILAPEFMVYETMQVSTEAAAVAMLSPDDPEHAKVAAYDYLAVPRFTRVHSSVEGRKYHFDVDLLVDFYISDGSKVTKIKGHGESTTGIHYPRSPREAGNLALRLAVEAVRDGVVGQRGLFVPAPAQAPAPPAASAEPVPSAAPGPPPIPVKVLLPIPEEFRGYMYVLSVQGREAESAIGREAERHFRSLLSPEFETLVIEPAASESAAMEMLSPDSPANIDARGFDYVAIPRFTRVDSWVRGSKYGFDAEIQIRFHPVGMQKDVTIKGYGEVSGPVDRADPADATAKAIGIAVKSLRQSIDGKRHLFLP